MTPITRQSLVIAKKSVPTNAPKTAAAITDNIVHWKQYPDAGNATQHAAKKKSENRNGNHNILRSQHLIEPLKYRESARQQLSMVSAVIRNFARESALRLKVRSPARRRESGQA